jgi:hypothetical protein
MDYRSIIAWQFRIGGLLLGLPALAILLKLGVDVWTVPPAPKIQPSQHLDVGTYGLVALLSDGAQGLGAMLGVLGTLAGFAAIAIGVVAALALLLGTLLYFTGGGVGRGENWARIVAIMVSIVFFLFWSAMLFADQRGVVAVAGFGTAVALATLWILGWRYA